MVSFFYKTDNTQRATRSRREKGTCPAAAPRMVLTPRAMRRRRAVLRLRGDAPQRARTGLTAARGARAPFARPHSTTEWRRWPDAGGVMSRLRVRPSHWPDPRLSRHPPPQPPAKLRCQVTFSAIHAAWGVYKAGH